MSKDSLHLKYSNLNSRNFYNVINKLIIVLAVILFNQPYEFHASEFPPVELFNSITF